MIDNLSKYDLKVFQVMNGFGKDHPSLNFVFYSFAVYLAYLMAIAIAAYLFLHQTVETVKTLLLALLAFVLARIVIAQSIYILFNRDRPFFTYKVNSILLFANKPSFPSGHATSMFAIATVFFMYDWRFGLLLYAIALLTVVSRVIAGVHFPSDIIAGALIGIVSGIFIVKVFAGPITPIAENLTAVLTKSRSFTK